MAADRGNAVRMAENGKRLVLDLYDTANNSRRFYDLISENSLRQPAA